MMQNQNQQGVEEKARKMINDIKTYIYGDFKDAVKEMQNIEQQIKSVEDKIKTISKSLSTEEIGIKDIGLNNSNDIENSVESVKNTLENAGLSLFTLKNVKHTKQDQEQAGKGKINSLPKDNPGIRDIIDVGKDISKEEISKEISKEVFNSIGSQDKLFVLGVETVLADINVNIEHFSQNNESIVTKLENSQEDINKNLNSLKEKLIKNDGSNKKEVEQLKTNLKDKMNKLFVPVVKAVLEEASDKNNAKIRSVEERVKRDGCYATRHDLEQKQELCNRQDEISKLLGSLKKKLKNDGENKNEVEQVKTELNGKLELFDDLIDNENSFLLEAITNTTDITNYNPANDGNFFLFRVLTHSLNSKMNKFKAKIRKELDKISQIENKNVKNNRKLLAGLVFYYECGQFNNFAHDLQHIDEINLDAWNEKSIFNIKYDGNKEGNLNNGGRGLNNIGATCYMNSMVQGLRHMEGLNDKAWNNFGVQQISDANQKIKDKDTPKSYNMTHAMINLVKKLDSNNSNPYSPTPFKEALGAENPLFAGIAANDSKDLVNFLLQRWHEENNFPITLEPEQELPNNQLDRNQVLSAFQEECARKYNSFISKLFYGKLEIQSQCTVCNWIKYNFQVYNFIEFPLEKVNNYCRNNSNIANGFPQLQNSNATNPDIDLDTCWLYYRNPELMGAANDNQMYCGICRKNTDTLYRNLLYQLPKNLVINLNRGRNAAYECNVFFPDHLDCYTTIVELDKFKFMDLVAIICHLGESSENGHFIAYIRSNYDWQWYKYNDGFVTKVEGDVFGEIRRGMPYILLYREKNAEKTLWHVLPKVIDPILKLEIQCSFNKLAKDAKDNKDSKLVKRKENFAYLLMCAVESNLDKDKRPTLRPDEISYVVKIAYNMIKDKDDLWDDNRVEAYRKYIVEFMSIKKQFQNDVIGALEAAAQTFRGANNYEKANLCEGYKNAIKAKLEEIGTKRPQDMRTFMNLLCCTANYECNINEGSGLITKVPLKDCYLDNWLNLLGAAYEMIKSDTKLSDETPLKQWQSGTGSWNTIDWGAAMFTSRECYYRDNITTIFNYMAQGAKFNDVNSVIDEMENCKWSAPYDYPVRDNIMITLSNGKSYAQRFYNGKAIGMHIKLYGTDSLVLDANEMLKEVLGAFQSVTQKYPWDKICCPGIKMRFEELNSNPEEQKRFIYLLAYPIKKYKGRISNIILFTLISVIYEMIRTEKNLCDDTLISGDPVICYDMQYQVLQNTGYNRMDWYKFIIDDTAKNAIRNNWTCEITSVRDYVNQYKVAYDPEMFSRKPGFSKPIGVVLCFYARIDYYVSDPAYRRAIIDKTEELQLGTNWSARGKFIELIDIIVDNDDKGKVDSNTLSNLACAAYEMIKDDFRLSDKSKLSFDDENLVNDKDNVQRADYYKRILQETFDHFKDIKNALIMDIVKYMSSNYKIANDCPMEFAQGTTQTGEQAGREPKETISIFPVNKPMNIRLYDMDSPITAQKMIDEVLGIVSNQAYKSDIKNHFDSLKNKSEEQKIFAYLLRYAGADREFAGNNLSNFVCATFDTIKDQFDFKQSKSKGKKDFIDIKANEKIIDDAATKISTQKTVSTAEIQKFFKNKPVIDNQNDNDIKDSEIRLRISLFRLSDAGSVDQIKDVMLKLNMTCGEVIGAIKDAIIGSMNKKIEDSRKEDKANEVEKYFGGSDDIVDFNINSNLRITKASYVYRHKTLYDILKESMGDKYISDVRIVLNFNREIDLSGSGFAKFDEKSKRKEIKERKEKERQEKLGTILRTDKLKFARLKKSMDHWKTIKNKEKAMEKLKTVLGKVAKTNEEKNKDVLKKKLHQWIKRKEKIENKKKAMEKLKTVLGKVAKTNEEKNKDVLKKKLAQWIKRKDRVGDQISKGTETLENIFDKKDQDEKINFLKEIKERAKAIKEKEKEKKKAKDDIDSKTTDIDTGYKNLIVRSMPNDQIINKNNTQNTQTINQKIIKQNIQVNIIVDNQSNPYTLSAWLGFLPFIPSIILIFKVYAQGRKLTGGNIALMVVGIIPVISAIVFGIMAYKYSQNIIKEQDKEQMKAPTDSSRQQGTYTSSGVGPEVEPKVEDRNKKYEK